MWAFAGFVELRQICITCMYSNGAFLFAIKVIYVDQWQEYKIKDSIIAKFTSAESSFFDEWTLWADIFIEIFP